MVALSFVLGVGFDMFDNFEEKFFQLKDAKIYAQVGGSGPPLMLLHGYPQTHFAWHVVAPILAEQFTVVVPDLRGYGKSTGPDRDTGHEGYSKRSMAKDIIDVMDALGHSSFFVAGHDRGGRVAYRMALDFPDKIKKLVVLDIIPTLEALDRVNAQSAHRMYHWFFLAQPYPVPEELIEKAAGDYIQHFIEAWVGRNKSISSIAMNEYRRCFENPRSVLAACEDYRAGLSVDAEHDLADRNAGRKIDCPMLVIWGEEYRDAKASDPIGIWEKWAVDVQSISVPTGHFPMEEEPVVSSEVLMKFFMESNSPPNVDALASALLGCVQ